MAFTLALIIGLLAVTIAVYLFWYYAIFVRKYPPGPCPLPVVGNLLLMPSEDLHLYFDKLSDRFGPVYTLYLPTPHVMLTRQDDIRRFLIAKGQEFSMVGPQFNLLANIPNGGIISANGDSWREQRRIALKILHDFGMGKALMEDRIMSSVQLLLDYLDDSLEDSNVVELFVPFQICLGNVINKILFGYAVKPAESERMLHFLEIITQFFVNFMAREMVLYNSWPWTKRVPILNWAYKRAEGDMRRYYEFIKAEVDAQIAEFDPDSPTATTFVHAYLKELAEAKNPYLSTDQLYCVVSDFWLAGMETTITALRWAILYLIEFSYAQERAQEEIDRVVGRDRFVSVEDRPRMPYMNALILEVERYSVMGTTLFRVCGVEQQIAGKEIPANTDYMFHVYSDNMRYTSYPYVVDEFRPERFLQDDGTSLRKDVIDRFTAFGMGKRQCPGEGLAKMELFLILTTLLQRYEFKATEICNGKVDLTYTYGLIIYPKEQPVQIVKRVV